MKKYFFIILLFTSCQLKKKEITLNDFYEKYGGVTFEMDGRKYSSYSNEKLYIKFEHSIWEEDYYYGYIFIYELTDSYKDPDPLYITLKKLDVGSYFIGNSNKISFGYYKWYGDLQITENNGEYVRGTFNLKGEYTNPYTGVKTYKDLINGKFKLFIK